MLQWEQMISLLITENIKLSTITPRLWLNICVKDDMKYDLWNAYGMLEGHELSCDICQSDFCLRNGRTDLDKVARVKFCRSYFISSTRSSYSHSAPMSSSDNLLRFLLILRDRDTAIAPNHYIMIITTERHSGQLERNAHNSCKKCSALALHNALLLWA